MEVEGKGELTILAKVVVNAKGTVVALKITLDGQLELLEDIENGAPKIRLDKVIDTCRGVTASE